MRRLTLPLLFCALHACRCGDDVNQVETRFRLADTEGLDFGRVPQGEVRVKSVTLFAETRVAVELAVRTDAPFSVADAVAEIPGGGQLDLPVSFTAGSGVATGELVVTAGRQEVRVPLKGFGIEKRPCTPSATCRESTFSFELERCVETVSPDETPCDPDSQCLEQGRCRAGQCLGVARRCDDNDACTSDACATDAGCLHPRITCPTPTMPCRVPTCDARTGCGEAVAPDGTPCGPSNCVSVRVCFAGGCREVPTPDGIECGPAIACYGTSRCANQRCVRPDAGPYQPTWTARVEGVPLGDAPGVLASPGNTLSFSVCGLSPLPDDGGSPDAGADSDAGLDAGPDAGPASECAVLSYTSTGFDRFIVRTLEAEHLAHVSAAGLVLRVDGGLLLRSRSTGAVIERWATADLGPTQLAALNDGGVVIAVQADGGGALEVRPGSGALVAFDDAVAEVAVDLDDTIVALTELGRLWAIASLADGGVAARPLADGGARGPLAVDRGVVVSGERLWLERDDGGVDVVQLDAPPDAGVLPRGVVVTPSSVVVFFKGCRVLPMSCLPADEALWARAYSRLSGDLEWEDLLVPFGAGARLVEAAVLRVPAQGGGLASVLEVERAGEFTNGLVVSVDGGRALECPFPAGTGRLVGAAFQPNQLVTLSLRPDGGVALEGWPLGPLPLETSGWSTPEGRFGQRRPAP